MATIIAGRFEQQTQAQEAIAQMLRVGFPQDQIRRFTLIPPDNMTAIRSAATATSRPAPKKVPMALRPEWLPAAR
jgi:hypothetical protein